MKGQNLFVRRSAAEDAAALAGFYAREEVTIAEALLLADGLIGKVVGEPIAHLAFERAGETLKIEWLYVARDFRRRGIGRWLLKEVEDTARGLRATAIEAPASGVTDSFFEASGFTSSDGVLQKVLPH